MSTRTSTGMAVSSRRSSSSRKLRRQAQSSQSLAEQAEEEAAAQLELNRRLASLQLPHMPASILTGGANSPSEPPTIRILVVADIDLESVSALAESALQDMPQNPLQRVDLCIACGPFCHEDDLRHYYQGRQRRRHAARHGAAQNAKTRSGAPTQVWRGGGGGPAGNALVPLPPIPHHSTPCYQNTSHSNSKQSTYPPGPLSSYPYKRSREETAALEGLMTAALSQLESIVCRVLFVPGKSDPISTITSSSTSLAYTKERRLTPNSRNIHQHWIPLCPGLGCAGLLYVDGQKLQQQPPPLEDDDEGIEDDDVTDSSHLLPEDSSFSYDRDENPLNLSPTGTQLPEPSLQYIGTGVASYEQQVKDYGSEFCQQLQDLVRLAPPLEAISNAQPSHAQVTDMMRTELFQSILVTHFHHFEPEHSSFSHEECKAIPTGGTSIIHNLGEHEDELELEDEEEESFDPPWPIDHEAFCALPQVQEHVMLEIAAGCNSQGRSVRPMELPKGMLRVVLPGSLRERGEFCLVDVAFMKTTGAIAGSKHGDYRWTVRQTQFQTIHDYI